MPSTERSIRTDLSPTGFLVSLCTCVFAIFSKPSTDFSCQCLSTYESDGDTDSNTIPNLPTPEPLLREWVKAELTRNSWKDALVASASVSILYCSGFSPRSDAPGLEFMVPRFTIYRAVCEHLEGVDRVADATECFRQMLNDPAVEANMHDEQAKWASGGQSHILLQAGC